MINLIFVYNRSRKSLKRKISDFDFEQMERDVKKLFQLSEKPFLLYYFDETNCKILILDEDDFTEIIKLAISRLTDTKIYLNLREKIISEIDNPDLLQGFFFKEFMRRQRNCFNKKRLISDLHSLKDSLQKAQIKLKIYRKILTGISKAIQLHFLDKSFPEKEFEFEEEANVNECLNECEPSCSSILDKHTTASFFSRNDMAVFGEVTRRPQRDKFKFKGVGVIEGPLFCYMCKEDLSDQIHFECEKCGNFTLCDECSKNVRHKHPLKPIFIVNDSKQKINALSRIFRKIQFVRLELFFDAFKKGTLQTKGNFGKSSFLINK